MATHPIAYDAQRRDVSRESSRVQTLERIKSHPGNVDDVARGECQPVHK